MKIGKTFLKEFIEYLKNHGSQCVTIDSTDLSGPHRYDGQLMVYLKTFRVQRDRKNFNGDEIDNKLEELDYWDLIHHIGIIFRDEKNTSGLIADLVKSGRLLKILRQLEQIIPQ